MDNPLFTIDPGLFIWSIIIFLLVLLILKRYAWTPLLDFIDEREKEISDSIDAERREILSEGCKKNNETKNN